MSIRLPFLVAVALAPLSGFGVGLLVDHGHEIRQILAQDCYRCHGTEQQKNGLRLDPAAYAAKGGKTSPALIPGNSAKSLIIQAVRGDHLDFPRMPYKQEPLADAEIALLAKWIDEGTSAPADEKPEETGSLQSRHWSFLAPERPREPDVKQTAWPRNAIDRFVLARLEKENIRPAPEADRVTLIRRLSLDLTGLPPTIDEVDAFVADTNPNAYERLVERLLSSPHYGERWARHWLDVARYADSNGYSIDAPRSIWKYRDWVIEALNRNLPFDLFTIHQLAGDLLPDAGPEEKTATGFHRNTQINEEGGIDKEQFRVESIIDRVNTTATAFLGLTFGCAQCHDHKFDPFTQKEYFRFYAFLNNADEPAIELASPEDLAQRSAIRAQVKTIEADLRRYLDSHSEAQDNWEKGLSEDTRATFGQEIRSALEIPRQKRTPKQRQSLADEFLKDDAQYLQRKAKLADLQKREPKIPTTMVLKERSEPRQSYVFIKGDFTRKGEVVTPGVPKVLPPLADIERPTRLDLARWIASPNNPLTARVIVNRLWQQYFGKGIVETENDFGTQGSTPSHPELLDWLATEFMRLNWDLKAAHRLIATSATYRQSSRARPELAVIDPNNRWLARQSRLRLDAEIVRDVALSASGLFSDRVGGPSVFPPLPDGVMTLGQVRREWKASTGSDRYRRGLYTFFWRSTPHPGLTVFDAPEGNNACTRRIRSNTPLQALTLLNDEGFFEMAEGLARSIVRDGPANDTERIEYAFRLCVARLPLATERQRLKDLLDQQLAENDRIPHPGDGAIPARTGASPRSNELVAWTTIARVLLNLDETITRE